MTINDISAKITVKISKQELKRLIVTKAFEAFEAVQFVIVNDRLIPDDCKINISGSLPEDITIEFSKSDSYQSIDSLDRMVAKQEYEKRKQLEMTNSAKPEPST